MPTVYRNHNLFTSPQIYCLFYTPDAYNENSNSFRIRHLPQNSVLRTQIDFNAGKGESTYETHDQANPHQSEKLSQRYAVDARG